jgi:hypothetical protein
MNRHYQNYLFKKYPALYKEHTLPMSETCMCWGVTCGDGWFNLINQLSEFLCSDWIYEKYTYDRMVTNLGQLLYPGSPESDFNPIITTELIAAVKVRMDDAELSIPVARQVKEKFGTLRFYVSNATEEQYSAIQFAEYQSKMICEVCGARGTVGGRGWISTRCIKHRK